MADAFTIDDAYDRSHASDGVSRYGAYLDINASWFTEDGNPHGPYTADPVGFASAAWSVASSPNMDPGYVRPHPRIGSATTRRSYEDGSLLADVTLCSDAPPPALRDLRGWGGWHREHGRLYEPSPRDVARQDRMLTTVQLLFCVPAGELYVPADAPERLTVSDARASVARVAELLGEQVGPVLAQLEDGR